MDVARRDAHAEEAALALGRPTGEQQEKRPRRSLLAALCWKFHSHEIRRRSADHRSTRAIGARAERPLKHVAEYLLKLDAEQQ